MEKKQAEAIFNHAVAVIAGTHSLAALEAEFGDGPEDPPIDLSTVATGDLDNYLCRRVIPTPGVALYLASGDPLTNHAIDQMELSIETAYGIAEPYYITSHREGKEGKNLTVAHFWINKEG